MQLSRRFGFWTSWFVVIASMVGSGILSNSGPLLQATGSPSALLLIWVVAGIISLTGSLTLGELASAYPRVGGDYSFVRQAFGRPWAFVYGWAMVVLGFAGPIALVSYSTASYFYSVIRGNLPFTISESAFIYAMASLQIVVLSIAHCVSHTQSAVLQNTITIFNIAVIGGFAGFALLSGNTTTDFISAGVPIAQVPWGSLGTGFIFVMYAYTGWNGAMYLAGEVKRPERNLPLSLGLGCLSVMALYVLVNVMYVQAVSPEQAKLLSDAEFSRFAEIAIKNALGFTASRWFSLLVSAGTFAALSAYILTGPRVVFAMAKDGLFPSHAGKLHPRSEIPVKATIVQGLIALALLWSGTFAEVLNFASYGLAVLSNLVIAPIFVLSRRKDFKPSFRTPLYPLAPCIFLLVNLSALISGLYDKPVTALLSLGSILLGFPIYFLLQRLGPDSFDSPRG